jgi:RHS repeat-associated protein
VQQAGNTDLVALASEARSFTSDGRAAAHGWQWHNDGTLGSQSHLRGFEYDHRGFITRMLETTTRISPLAVGENNLADLGIDGGVWADEDLDTFIEDFKDMLPNSDRSLQNIYEWSQHGTLLSQSQRRHPFGNFNGNPGIWSASRGSGTTNTQTPLMSSVRTSLTAADPASDAVTWDAWGRFTSHGGVSFDTIAFDDRPIEVTVDHDDIATPEAEHAASKRHHDPLGREVLEVRTAGGGTIERITKVWLGSRMLAERDEEGWSRTWHQRATDAYPFAYTITCDDTAPGADCLAVPEWLGGTNSAIAPGPDGHVTYALIHNYRGDVIGLLNEAGDIVEQYQYDLHGQLIVRACVSTGTPDPSNNRARPVDCLVGSQPLPGDHASQHGNTLLYAGNHRDPVTGQSRMGARWYSPTLRMFLSRDPAGYAFSFDEWAYTVGDPWNFVDRTGWGPEKKLNGGQSKQSADAVIVYQVPGGDDVVNNAYRDLYEMDQDARRARRDARRAANAALRAVRVAQREENQAERQKERADRRAARIAFQNNSQHGRDPIAEYAGRARNFADVLRPIAEFAEGGWLGNFVEDPTGSNIVGQIAVGFTPVGILGDIRDLTHGLRNFSADPGIGATVSLGADVVGFFPLGGDLARPVVAFGRRAARRWSSRALARALVRAGVVLPPGSAAHHIAASGSRRADEARAVLHDFGIDLDDPANGVFLPANSRSPNPTGAAVHSRLHTHEYYRVVNEMLGRARTREQAIEMLNEIRVRLQSGGL